MVGFSYIALYHNGQITKTKHDAKIKNMVNLSDIHSSYEDKYANVQDNTILDEGLLERRYHGPYTQSEQ